MDRELLFLWVAVILVMAIAVLAFVYGLVAVRMLARIMAIRLAYSRIGRRMMTRIASSVPDDFAERCEAGGAAVGQGLHKLGVLIGFIWIGAGVGGLASLGNNHGSEEERLREIYYIFGGAFAGLALALCVDATRTCKNRYQARRMTTSEYNPFQESMKEIFVLLTWAAILVWLITIHPILGISVGAILSYLFFCLWWAKRLS